MRVTRWICSINVGSDRIGDVDWFNMAVGGRYPAGGSGGCKAQLSWRSWPELSWRCRSKKIKLAIEAS